MGEENMTSVTQKLDKMKPVLEVEASNGNKVMTLPPEIEHPVKKLEINKSANTSAQSISKRVVPHARFLREQCRQLCLSVFFRKHEPRHSLGLTSSIAGEGKSFLSIMLAQALADDSTSPVALLECNWEHPSLHEYFGFSSTPGLAEWLRGECSEEDIRHKTDRNLTVIPAGDGERDAVKLLELIRQKGLLDMLADSNELLVVDLPAVVSTASGALAANLVEALVIVVRAGVTPEALVTRTCAQLKGLPVEGIIFNQDDSRIPRWIRQLL
jgi:Mrp family chromosome partitioning ATPase